MSEVKLLFQAMRRDGHDDKRMVYGSWYTDGSYSESVSIRTEWGHYSTRIIMRCAVAPAYDETVYFGKVYPVRSEE